MAPYSTIFGDDVIPSVGQSYTDKATVRAVQTALKQKGFDPGTVDGAYGPNTAAAVRKLQATIGAAQTGQIDYGVLMALGVSAPSAAAAGRAMADVSAVADATLKAHASADLEENPAKVQAVAALDTAKKQAAVAVTPAQKEVAQQKIEQASTQLVAVTGPWNANVPVINRPAWQVGLFALGGLTLTLGIVSLAGKRAR